MTETSFQLCASCIDPESCGSWACCQHPAPTPQIDGVIVATWFDAPYTFHIERLREPVLRGAGMRPFRLWCDGQPATGGQWHYTEEGARARAEYLVHCTRSTQINFLEHRVQHLEGVIARSQPGYFEKLIRVELESAIKAKDHKIRALNIVNTGMSIVLGLLIFFTIIR